MRDYEFDDEGPYVVIEKQTGGIGSFLLGIAVGAGVAILFAPRSGMETRQGISRGARRVTERARDLAEDVSGTVTDSFQEARGQVETRLESARQAIDFKRQQVARAMEAGRAAAQQARDDLERRIAETKAAYQAGEDVARSAKQPPGVVPAAGDADTGGGQPT